MTPFLLLLALASPDTLTVAAASDLAPLESALTKAYGGNVRFVFGASGSLLRQIENGAPFDVYLSANERYVEEGIARHVLTGPGRLYATGHVALWSLKSGIRTLGQLNDPAIRHIALANPAYAPYGAAAREALEKAGIWKLLEPKIVYGENVRQALQYAESGNADVALVSWSLVHDRGGVLVEGSSVRQAAAVVKASPAATRFLEWLMSPAAQAIFAAHGLSGGGRK